MNPHSAAVARSGNPLKSRFESETRAKIFSKSADPFTYSPPSINVGKIWKLLYCFYALMYLLEKILIMGFIERSLPRVALEYRIYSINRPGRLLNFWTLRVGAYSRWALIRGEETRRCNKARFL